MNIFTEVNTINIVIPELEIRTRSWSAIFDYHWLENVQEIALLQ